MISKELLSKVLGNKVKSIRLVEKYDGKLNKRVNGLHVTFEGYVENINIHEIAHRCKEWAWQNGYIISSFPTPAYWRVVVGSRKVFIADNETEAIFKACEWILKETK